MSDRRKRPVDLYPFKILPLFPSGAEIKKDLTMYMLGNSFSLEL